MLCVILLQTVVMFICACKCAHPLPFSYSTTCSVAVYTAYHFTGVDIVHLSHFFSLMLLNFSVHFQYKCALHRFCSTGSVLDLSYPLDETKRSHAMCKDSLHSHHRPFQFMLTHQC